MKTNKLANFYLALGSRFVGQPLCSYPHYKIRAERLINKFNKALTNERLNLEGRLLMENGIPYLSWGFEPLCPIFVESDFSLDGYENEEVVASGTKKPIMELRNNKPQIGGYIFKVDNIEVHEFDWTEALKNYKPEINLEDIHSFVEVSNNPHTNKAFFLSLIGDKSPLHKSGIGLTAYNPSYLHIKSIEPILKIYNKIDPLRNPDGTQYARYSMAQYASQENEKIIRRDIPQKEIDYLIVNRPDSSQTMIHKMLVRHAELFATTGDDGLNKSFLQKDFLNNLKFIFFFWNKAVKPQLEAENDDEISNATTRIQERMSDVIGLEKEDAALPKIMFTETKFLHSVNALAKAKSQNKITSQVLQEAEELFYSGISQLGLEPTIVKPIKELAEEVERDLRPPELPVKIRSAHDLIWFELRKNPRSEEELEENLKSQIDEKTFNQTFKYMHERGWIRKKDGKFFVINLWA